MGAIACADRERGVQEKAKQLVTPAKKPLGGRKKKDDDDSDDSHEEDFNPNLAKVADDEESDEEDSEDTKRKKAEQRKLEAAKVRRSVCVQYFCVADRWDSRRPTRAAATSLSASTRARTTPSRCRERR